MRIHLIFPGFTQEVFTGQTAPLLTIGADKILAIHTKVSDLTIEEKVQQTLNSIKNVYKGPFDYIELPKTAFSEIVLRIKKILESFSSKDIIYIHIGGGERHLAMASIFASSLTAQKINFISVVELENKFEYATVPKLPIIELGSRSR